MRALTTAIDEGEHKVPEGHKVTRYALAAGDAIFLEEGDRRYVIVDRDMAKRASYTFDLSWVEGRVVAQFEVDGKIVAQPIKDDPKEKRRKRDDERDSEAMAEGAGADQAHPGRHRAPVPALRPPPGRRGKLPLPEPGEEEGPAGPPEAGKRRPRRQRKPLSLRPLKL